MPRITGQTPWRSAIGIPGLDAGWPCAEAPDHFNSAGNHYDSNPFTYFIWWGLKRSISDIHAGIPSRTCGYSLLFRERSGADQPLSSAVHEADFIEERNATPGRFCHWAGVRSLTPVRCRRYTICPSGTRLDGQPTGISEILAPNVTGAALPASPARLRRT